MDRSVRLPGRILFLTEDAETHRPAARRRGPARRPRAPAVDNISTDELTPGWVCLLLRRDARPVLPGRPARRRRSRRTRSRTAASASSSAASPRAAARARDGAVQPSSRRGVQLVIAKSIEKIYGQNAQNIGLLTSTDFGLIDAHRARRGDPDRASSPAASTRSAPAIVEHGGLFAYNRARLAGEVVAAGDHDAAAPDDALREDHRRARDRRRDRPASSASPR